MKHLRLLFFAVLMVLIAVPASRAIPVFNMPAVRIQPNGDTLHCLVSGDEYYHRLHDANNYTIVQNPSTGYWVYADTVHTGRNRWNVVATDYVAGVVDPTTVQTLHPNVGVDRVTWQEMQRYFDVPKEYGTGSSPKTSGANHGRLNNVVIFIRFSDETEITTTLASINEMFNDSSATATSMNSYFKKVSYNKIDIVTHYYPTPSGNSVVSYQDSLPRSYYMPYNATTNTNGYQTDTERRNREFGLLERAVNYVNLNSPIPSTLNIDMDNDNYVDNICFVVKGTYTGWSDLLWPHKWSLYDRYVYINGKRVYTFNLQLEGSGSHYFSSSTFCHEMFHTLGAPDLYRYDNYTNVSGVGSWDLMCSNSTPPQHMGAYMKWKYGNWIDSIPTITIPGTYTLHSLGDDEYYNCCYKIAAQEPNQWYVLEYRDNTERFETTLPGKGLLIYRIDDRFNGNAGYDGTSTFDEVYLFRPNASDDTTNGTLSQAYFSGSTSRTSFTPTTNPHPWLTGNVIDTTIAITNVTTPGVTISFTYVDMRGCRKPIDPAVDNISGTSAQLSWSGNAGSYRVQYRVAGSTGNPTTVVVNAPVCQLTGLSLGTQYQWRVQGMCSSTETSPYSDWQSFTTATCYQYISDSIGNADTSFYYIPINTYYNYTYTQMIYTAAEMGGAINISKIAYHYASTNPMSSKTNCVIYMGNTSQSTFSGTAMSDFVPFSQLQKVYEGPLNCVQGWNEFTLDSVFSYNGTDNLVIAIDDNSGDYDGSNYKFYCNFTGNEYRTLNYYSDNYNPDPTSTSSFSGTKTRRKYRPDIMFKGCPALQEYTVTVSSHDTQQGTVSGGGTYPEGTAVTITATPASGYQFDHWTSNGTTVTTNPYTFTVTGDISFEAWFVPASYTVTVTAGPGGSVTGGGNYERGTTAVLGATPDQNYHFAGWTSPSFSDTIHDNPYVFQVWNDASFTAHFALDYHQISVISANPQYGNAWLTIDGTQASSASLPHGTQVTIHAEPRTDVENTTCYFISWSDQNNAPNRVLTLNQDTLLYAYFDATTIGIEQATESVTVFARGRNVEIIGVAGETVSLYDISGRCLYQGITDGHLSIPVGHPGVYIVRFESIPTKKVVVGL